MITIIATLLIAWLFKDAELASISNDAWLIFAGLFILSLSNEMKGK